MCSIALKCHDRMVPIALIQEPELIEKILTHLQLPLRPEELRDGTVVYDVTDEPMLEDEGWTLEASSQSRAPPSWDGIDPPCPEE